MRADVDAERKRVGIVVPETSGTGLASRRAGGAGTQARTAVREVISLDSAVRLDMIAA